MFACLVSMKGKPLSSTEDSVAFFHLKKHKGMGGPPCSGIPCAPAPLRVSDWKLYTRRALHGVGQLLQVLRGEHDPGSQHDVCDQRV